MKPALVTEVELPHLSGLLRHDAGVVLLGSCFADEMARPLADRLFTVCSNPLGPLFNPLSILAALSDKEPRPCPAPSVEDGRWRSWDAHGSISGSTPEEVVAAVCEARQRLHDALRHAAVLFVTLGTTRTFAYEGRTVTNCHKFPATIFHEHILTPEETRAAVVGIRTRAQALNASLRVVFTVSPVRHMGTTLHGNALSKATLLLATADEEYFPAYELLTDELRDYRYYAADMRHPSPLAVDIIHDALMRSCCDARTLQIADEALRFTTLCRHRPAVPEKHRAVICQHLERLCGKHPQLRDAALQYLSRYAHP